MTKKRLGVNIDHVATIRNARGEYYPDPLRAALEGQRSGADSITIHLREDRRHIREGDLKHLKKKLSIPINLEMAPTYEMLKIALRNKPNFVCLVPEKRNELTTEGGLNLKKNNKKIRKIIKRLKEKKIRVSVFIDPIISNINLAYDMSVDCIELHTGTFCIYFNNGNKTKIKKLYNNIENCSKVAKNFGIDVHAGHGLTYGSAKTLSKIDYINEFNIGHFIVSEALFVGLESSIKKFKKIISS